LSGEALATIAITFGRMKAEALLKAQIGVVYSWQFSPLSGMWVVMRCNGSMGIASALPYVQLTQ